MLLPFELGKCLYKLLRTLQVLQDQESIDGRGHEQTLLVMLKAVPIYISPYHTFISSAKSWA